MVSMLGDARPGTSPPSVADFTKGTGPWIIVATVLVPLIVAATVNWLKARGRAVCAQRETRRPRARTAMNHLYSALVAPLAELTARLGWAVLIVIGFILTYTLCYNIWSSFAFPFYLDFLHYSKDEVAFASKVFGIFMTILGISLGGYLFLRSGGSDHPHRRDPPGVRQFRLCRSRRGRRAYRLVAHFLFLDRAGRSASTSGWCGCSSPSPTRISRPASPGPRSSPTFPGSSARSSRPSNMPCCRR
jgi:hypothetical protein